MEEQERIKRQGADICGMAALAYPVVLYGTRALLSLWLGLRVRGASLANPLGLSEAQAVFWQMLPGVLALMIPGTAAIWAAGLSARRMHWRKAPAGAVERWMPFFLGVVAAAELLGSLLARLLRLPKTHTALPQTGAGLGMCYLAVCILPAVGEELFFRGVLQGLLRPVGRGASIWGAAVLFCLLHSSLPQCIAALAGGLVLGLCAQVTGSLMPCILLHLTHNTIAFTGLWLEQYSIGGAFHFALLVLLPLWALCSQRQAPRRRLCPVGGPVLPRSAGYLVAVAGLGALCAVRSLGLV